jgi:hypothetical protein
MGQRAGDGFDVRCSAARLCGVAWALLALGCAGAGSDDGDAAAIEPDALVADVDEPDADEPEVSSDADISAPVALGCDADDWLDLWVGPYRLCSAGFVQLEHVTEHGGPAPSAISVFGQFVRTYKESQVVWDDVTLYESAGLDDCTVIDHGNSGKGESEQVVWFDVGDVTIAWDGPDAGSVVASGGDGEVVSYQSALPVDLWEEAREMRIELAPGGASPLPSSVSVASPTLLEVTTPPAEVDDALPASALRFQWAGVPSGGEDGALMLSLVGPIVKGRQRLIRCALEDDGDFTVPAALAAYLQPPVEVRWTMTRIRSAVSGSGPDGASRVVAVRANSAVWGKSWIE